MIAINRGAVFFKKATKAFESPFTFLWLLLIWILPLGIEYSLYSAECRFQLDEKLKKFRMKCEPHYYTLLVYDKTPTWIQLIDTILQICLPVFILFIYCAILLNIAYVRNLSLKTHEITILKQAIFTFVVFQAPSFVFLGANFFKISQLAGFLIKRFVNTMEIFAGVATPAFFFFTSQEVRKIMSSRVYASNSNNDADAIPQRRMRATT